MIQTLTREITKAIILVSVFVFVSGCGTAIAQGPAGRPAFIGVTGVGTVAVKADTGLVVLGAGVVAPSLVTATEDVATRMGAVRNILKNLGVADPEITTLKYAREPVYARPGEATSPVTGHRVTHIIQIKVRRLDQTAAVVDAATSAGANIVEKVTFDVDDVMRLRAEARALAVKDASRKATELASRAGVRLGGIVQIVEQPPLARPMGPTPSSLADAIARPNGVEVGIAVEVQYAIGTTAWFWPLSRIFPPVF